MATLVGKVGMVMKGDWSSSATYEALDAVSYNNALYIAKQNVPANTAPTNTTYWQVAIDAATKADKVGSTTAGRIASLTADGNLADSQRTIADFISLWNFAPYYTDVDFNNLPYGVSNVIPDADTTNMPPVSENGWIVMTVGGKYGANTFAFQLAVGYSNNIYIRRCWGSWGTWKALSS